jgi:hypothetical protein
MGKKFPGRMTYTQWKRTPFRKKHRLFGSWLNTKVFCYWRDCDDARCRRARSCQDHECYWRRLQKLPTTDEMSRVRKKAASWTWLLWEGSSKGSEGRQPY